jgi:signal transduction histidine kinase
MNTFDAALFRTSTFRLTALYGLVFIVSVSILFAAVGYVARGSMRAQIAMSVQRDAVALADEYEATGGSRASDLIEHQFDRAPLSYYLIESATGRRLAGNITAVPLARGLRDVSVQPQRAKRGFETGDEVSERRDAIGYGVRTQDGDFVFVASDSERVSQLEKAILTAFAIGGGLSLLLAVAGGLTVGRGFLRRIEAINRTSREIISGRFDARIAVSDRDDELGRLALNLNAAFDRVEGLMENLRQVSSDVAHDLRTPLARLRQTLELVRSTALSVDEFRASVDMAIDDADQILETFSALLRIAQIESGSRKSGFGPINLSELLETLVETYAIVCEESGHELTARISPELHIVGDRELLQQLGANLIENAVRHTGQGVPIEIDAFPTKSGALVAVCDTGPGIPASEHAKVVRRFYRLESSRTTPGSGLGLALVAAITDLHGAKLSLCDNCPGLRVEIRFPPVGPAPGWARRKAPSRQSHADAIAVPNHAHGQMAVIANYRTAIRGLE